MKDDTDLDALRAELDTLDQRLLETAARRLEIARRIGAVKARSARALFDRGRERQVLDRARRLARERGLPGDLGERLVHTLVEAAHEVQASALSEAPSPDPRRVLVVGGAGEMGRLFVQVLQRRGHAVDILERGDGRDRAAAVQAGEVILVAVDMDQTVEVVRALAPHVGPEALICDVNSLKEEVCGVYAAMERGQAVGLHPMFGGTVGSLRRQKVVACPVRPGPLVDWLRAELAHLGVEWIESDPVSHDRAMAVVQVLLHFRTVVMGEALRRTGMPVAESLRFTSPIYRLELSVVARLFAQDPDLYAAIIFDNPRSAEVRRHFQEAAAAVEGAVVAGDREAFRGIFERVHDHFGGFSEEAMRMSDALIDFLVARA